MNARSRLIVAAALIGSIVTVTGCARYDPSEEPIMTASDPHAVSAKARWLEFSEQIAATQAIVGGTWESVDTAASECGAAGAQWGIGRLGPGVPEADRHALYERIETAWRAFGWDPTLTKLYNEEAGLQLRYPASGGFDDGFFVEIGSSVHGTSIGGQTPCGVGDVDALNEEHFADEHSPGVTWPESSPPLP